VSGRLRTSDTSLDRLVKARSIVGSFIAATVTELQLSGNSLEKEGIKSGSRRGSNGSRRCRRNIARGTGVLATIGATAPFVGLFGTVWGIMNSFIGISKSHTTNLAVVAPGIAEALPTTALEACRRHSGCGHIQRVLARSRAIARWWGTLPPVLRLVSPRP
jgi:biopolymer transport protein ExbB/TolQ